jgi:hypothetical protein
MNTRTPCMQGAKRAVIRRRKLDITLVSRGPVHSAQGRVRPKRVRNYHDRQVASNENDAGVNALFTRQRVRLSVVAPI